MTHHTPVGRLVHAIANTTTKQMAHQFVDTFCTNCQSTTTSYFQQSLHLTSTSTSPEHNQDKYLNTSHHNRQNTTDHQITKSNHHQLSEHNHQTTTTTIIKQNRIISNHITSHNYYFLFTLPNNNSYLTSSLRDTEKIKRQKVAKQNS